MSPDPELAAAALVFVEVADCGSFTRAAARLGVSKSTVSGKVRELEARLGVRLLARTTRAVSVTDDGAAFLESVTRMREHWQDAKASLERRGHDPVGVLRLTAPASLSDVLVAPLVCEMMADYPELEVDLLAEDRTLDLVRDNIDLAIRVGALSDSSLVARRVGQEHGWIAVKRESPWDALLRGDADTVVDALTRVPFVGMRGAEPELELTPRDGGEPRRIAPRYRAWTPSGQGLLSLVSNGAGAAALPDSMMALGASSLRVVLPNYTVSTYPLWLVRPSRRHAPERVRVFVERLEQRLATPIFDPLR
ncbi:MAG: LysR substrate-binding domain-containing protein [Myxococcota bacterium]